MGKHDRQDEHRIIQLRDYQPLPPDPEGQPEEGADRPEAEIEYEGAEAPGQKKKRMVAGMPKAVYQVAVILLALVVGLSIWMNRTNLSPENIGAWLKLQVTGAEIGDGYPVQITGSEVADANFLAQNGNAVILSDTALTILNPTGRDELSLRHSLNNPVLQGAGGRFLLYNSGSTGYMTLSGAETVASGVQRQDILSGAIAQNGRFALGIQGSNGASELNVYQRNGALQAHYLLARDYITAVALNYDGSYGMVCTVRSDKGTLVSKILIYDFNSENPVAEYETSDNLLLAAHWGENGMLYAVGDTALLSASSSDYQFAEENYQGRQLTAFRLEGGRAFLSISAYEHAGPSTLFVYGTGSAQPVKVEEDRRIEAISVYGGSVGVLMNGQAVFYDFYTGAELGRADAGGDAKALALSSESACYVLGVSEVRSIKVE